MDKKGQVKGLVKGKRIWLMTGIQINSAKDGQERTSQGTWEGKKTGLMTGTRAKDGQG